MRNCGETIRVRLVMMLIKLNVEMIRSGQSTWYCFVQHDSLQGLEKMANCRSFVLRCDSFDSVCPLYTTLLDCTLCEIHSTLEVYFDFPL